MSFLNNLKEKLFNFGLNQGGGVVDAQPEVSKVREFARDNGIAISGESPSLEQIMAFANRNRQPTPTPQPQELGTNVGFEYRNPMVEGWINNPQRSPNNQNPLKTDEIMSGIDIASNEYNVPKDLLTDITGLESMLGYYDRPINQYPGQYDDEKHARGMNMFLKATADAAGLDDRHSATESARATARKLNKGQLGEWDISDKAGAGGGKLTDFYSEEELEPYSFASLARRAMLSQL